MTKVALLLATLGIILAVAPLIIFDGRETHGLHRGAVLLLDLLHIPILLLAIGVDRGRSRTFGPIEIVFATLIVSAYVAIRIQTSWTQFVLSSEVIR